MIKIALAGNPNCGKTTLFNTLTGSNQYVGNWPGVTVEKKEGKLKGHQDVVIQDLPGIYSLSPYSPEEVVTRTYLVNEHPDAILNIVDGTNIERNLYLTTQLIELGHPVVVAVNMIDLVRKNGDTIDLEKLSRALGCVCVEISALKSEGVFEAAEKAVALAKNHTHGDMPHVLSGSVEHALAHIEESIEGKVKGNYLRWYAIKLFERDEVVRAELRLDRERILADRQARTKNEDQLRLQRETANLEQKRLQATMEENRLLDKLWDTYGVTHQGAQTIRQKISNLSQATRQAGQLREAIRRLGHVNLGAMEEFQRVEERYHYLNDQKTDVETAQRELEIIIQGITEEMREVFLREFTRIQTAFSQTFTDLFGGGQGALALEDEKEVLTCGIDIRVQPPGKTLRTISLLSGGERALVAIALYFAIIQVHPTPFCVMDEIEAALDESNGARFIRYLRAMGHSTQFIFITHRRETMEAADLLYGVTMERQGISKILKLDLKQAEELLQTAPKS